MEKNGTDTKAGCCCHDSQAVFFDRAVKQLNLSPSQQDLLLQSFRKPLLIFVIYLKKYKWTYALQPINWP